MLVKNRNEKIATTRKQKCNGFAACLYALLFDGTIFRNDVFSELNSRTTDQSKQVSMNVMIKHSHFNLKFSKNNIAIKHFEL